MAYADDLRTALAAWIPANQLHYMDGWKREWYRPTWAGNKGRPSALILHHTAGAATAATDPDNAGNQHGANDGTIAYVNRHPSYDMPASAFTLDRDGCLYVNAALPCYHAGAGSFTGTQWAGLGIPNDSANSYCLGVEIVDKGTAKTFTDAQKSTLGRLALACRDASGWADASTGRLPRHKDWAPERKIDIQYSNATVQEWVAMADSYWDGKIPDIQGILNAEADPTLKNPAAYRLACRLADLGYGSPPQPEGVQGYPVKAIEKRSRMVGYDAIAYGPNAHAVIFPT